MHKLLSACALITLLLLGQSCSKNTDDQINDNNPITGTVTGKVVAGNNTRPVNHALVFISAGSKLYYTYSDRQGNFSLKAPAGSQKLHIQTGDGSMFRTVIPVDIIASQTIVVPSTSVRLLQVATLAYVAGNYDKIEQLLIDSMGYAATALSPLDLQNINTLIQYDAIFLNCGSNNSSSVSASTDQALGDYVANGGSLYVSDWAVAYLMGQTLTSSSPCGVPKSFGFIPDSTLCSRRTGSMGMFYGTQIVSTDLQQYMGKTTMDINYDLGSWEKIQSIDNSFWETMIKENGTNLPLLVRTNNYTNPNAGNLPRIGNVDSNYVTICHVQQDSTGTSTSITISISINDLATHLAHGDHVGECNNPNSAGRIYFTTFHNEPNGLISPDVKSILEFMILNL